MHNLMRFYDDLMVNKHGVSVAPSIPLYCMYLASRIRGAEGVIQSVIESTRRST